MYLGDFEDHVVKYVNLVQFLFRVCQGNIDARMLLELCLVKKKECV